ncbi:MAG TPA: hypothetical protein EYQ00_06885 [Dehalococcoidia bacterium]|jgi:hypothetical protein|nr:hypothetical protein [Dehalococcoidia bacterium]
MPQLGSHLHSAYVVANRLQSQTINADRGAFFLGSTSPDIRVITHGDRADTHFFDLDHYEAQDSIKRMFSEHPNLKFQADMDTTAASFVAGYITHLVLDELFISEIYRPYFGLYSTNQGTQYANLLDRALQYQMDLMDRSHVLPMSEVVAALSSGVQLPAVPFIEPGSLEEWLAVSIDVASQPPDYSRFEKMILRHMQSANLADDAISDLLGDPQRLVAEASSQIESATLREFWLDAHDMIEAKLIEYFK